jgi:transposase-like protein
MGPTKLTLTNVGNLTEDGARTTLESIRWPDGPVCPHCASDQVTRIQANSETIRSGLFQCNGCRGQFTVTLGTIFEDSHIPLRKWVLAFALMCSSKKGISALQLQRNLNLGSYRTAWFMAHRIRYAMTMQPLRSLLQGTVEVDETYVGGKGPGKRGRSTERKTPVVALVERGGRVRTKVTLDVSAKNLKDVMRQGISPKANIVTDEFTSYGEWVGREFAGHQAVNHRTKEYVRGSAHVNNRESFFALLKRGVHGTFHHVSREHPDRYCDEFSFRWDHRKVSDDVRTASAIQATEGKRLMFKRPNPI